MDILLYGAAPVLAIGLWAGWRAWHGRPVRRYTLNLAIALLLFAYFAITAGLGIFWVANQELPVFDLHYLFGYLTILMVTLHVIINWKPIVRYVRRHAPRAAVTEDGRKWRPGAAWAGRIGGLALYGGFCFWLGYGQGSTELTVQEGDEVERPDRPLQSPQTPTGTSLPEPRGVKQQLVTENGERLPLADYYHRRSKHTRASVAQKGGKLDWSRRPEPFKPYPGASTVPLPKPGGTGEVTTAEAIERRRAPGADESPVSLAQLSTLLHLAQGVTGITRYPHATYHLRAAPASGALYPTITYVVVREVGSLEPGLYHYDVKDHALHLLRAGTERVGDLAGAVYRPETVRAAKVTLLFSTEYFRSAWKYEERAWRYCLLDAGHAAGQATLAAAALGLSSHLIGRFDDRKVNAVLGLHAAQEGALLVVPIGGPSGAPAAAQPRFEARPQTLGSDDVPDMVSLAQGRTVLARVDTGGPVKAFPAPKPVRNEAGTDLIPLPREGLPTGERLDATVERRRSARRWDTQAAVALRDLSQVLHLSFGQTGGRPDPTVESIGALRLYVVVHRADGVPPGVYAYRRETHALARIRSGDQAGATHAMSLFQEVVRDAGVVLVKTMDARTLDYPDGARGYRYGALDAGMLGANLYLSTTALGLGATGIGAFFDDEVSALIKVPPNREHIIYVSAFGVPTR